MTTAPTTSRDLVRWRNAVFTIFGLGGFAFATWASRVPAVRELLRVNTETIGWLVFGISLGSILGLIAASHIVTRLGATRTIRWLYSLAGVALVLAGVSLIVAPGFLPLFVFLAAFGAGGSVTDVAMNLSGAANERAAGRTLMPLFHAAWSLGTVLGAAVGALMELLGVSVPVHFIGVGVVAVAVTQTLVRFLQPAEDAATEHEAGGGWRARLAVWRNPNLLLIGVVVLGATFAEGGANDWLGLAMVDGHGFDPAGGALVLSVFLAAMTAGRVGGVVLLDRFGRVRVLRASSLAAVVGLAIVIFVDNDVLVIAGVVLWGLGTALGFPVGMSAAADDPRAAAARVTAVATIGYAAFLVGPPLIGILGERIGILHALIAVLVLVALGGLAASAARERTGSTADADR